MATYKIRGTKKLKDRVSITIPVNHAQCQHFMIGPNEELRVETGDAVVEAPIGTVGVMKRKGYIEVEEVVVEQSKKPAQVVKPLDPPKVKEEELEEKVKFDKKDKHSKDMGK